MLEKSFPKKPMDTTPIDIDLMKTMYQKDYSDPGKYDKNAVE